MYKYISNYLITDYTLYNFRLITSITLKQFPNLSLHGLAFICYMRIAIIFKITLLRATPTCRKTTGGTLGLELAAIRKGDGCGT